MVSGTSPASAAARSAANASAGVPAICLQPESPMPQELVERQLKPASPIEGLPPDMTAESLPRTAMGDFLEQCVRRRLVSLGEEDAAETVTLRVVSSNDRTHQVHPLVRTHFGSRDEGQEYPMEMAYRTKGIFLFQRIDGVDVALFSM